MSNTGKKTTPAGKGSNVFEGARKKMPSSRIDKVIATTTEEQVMHAARVPLSLSQAIKKLAIEERSSVQALTIEALQELLKSKGVDA